MDKEYLVQLTNNIYHLTLLFPKKEPLRYKIRELADDILSNVLCIIGSNEINDDVRKVKQYLIQTQEDIDVLDGFLQIAKNQNWVGSNDILSLWQEYNQLKEWVKEKVNEDIDKDVSENKVVLDKNFDNSFQEKETVPVIQADYHTEEVQLDKSFRQKKILQIIKDKQRIQVWEVKKIFPQVSKRTLRRDFEELLKKGLIKRIGKRNNTFYHLIS